MDCINDAGDAAILYCASVRWHSIHLNYGSVVYKSETDALCQTSLGRFQVDVKDRRIGVELPGLKVIGEWNAASAPVEQTVYKGSTGSVHWNCMQPGSLAWIRIGDHEFAGLGYAECLTLTVPPWQLPMRTLRWGRFVSAEDALVWIDWQGPYSTSFAFLNGRKLKLHQVSESKLTADGATLCIRDSAPIRTGQLSRTILPAAPALGKIFPHSLFNIEEHKWRIRGVLDADGHRAEGWVIHEVVHWNL